MIDYDRIRKDCFWDLNISNNRIDEILEGSDFRSKAFLFEIFAEQYKAPAKSATFSKVMT